MSIEDLTFEKVEELRDMQAGTNERELKYDKSDVSAMKRKLEKLYQGRVTLSFAEKVLLRYMAYEEESA